MGDTSPLGKKNLFNTSGLSLPPFIRSIAHALIRDHGMQKGRAIATAISQCKRWSAGGENVDPKTRAKAAAALAQWESSKLKARATPNKGEK